MNWFCPYALISVVVLLFVVSALVVFDVIFCVPIALLVRLRCITCWVGALALNVSVALFVLLFRIWLVSNLGPHGCMDIGHHPTPAQMAYPFLSVPI